MKVVNFAACSALMLVTSHLQAQVSVDIINLVSNDIAFNAPRNELYASVPSSAGAPRGNSITTLSGQTGDIQRSVFVGSEPSKLAVARDGSAVYVGLNGAAAVRRYNPATAAAGIQFAVGRDPFLGSFYVDDMEVMPGSPDTVAISRRNLGFSPRHEGVGIYDNGVQRPTTTPGHTGADVIEFSDSPSVLYGYNNETTEFGLRRIQVDSSGATTTNTYGNVLSGFGVDIRFDDGLVYATTGQVADPETGNLVGSYSGIGSGGLVAPDSAHDSVYFLTGSGSTRQLKIYNQETFLLNRTINISGVSGDATSLTNWGDGNLAFRTSGGQIFLIHGAPAPSSIVTAAFGIVPGALLLFRRRRIAQK